MSTKRKNKQYNKQEKTTLNKPKLETRIELKKIKKSKTKENRKQKAKTNRTKEITYLEQDQVITQKQNLPAILTNEQTNKDCRSGKKYLKFGVIVTRESS